MFDLQWEGVGTRDALDLAGKGDEDIRADEAMTGEKARGSLARELERWQEEQERRFNRAWRRPGGLARSAGL